MMLFSWNIEITNSSIFLSWMNILVSASQNLVEHSLKIFNRSYFKKLDSSFFDFSMTLKIFGRNFKMSSLKDLKYEFLLSYQRSIYPLEFVLISSWLRLNSFLSLES
jgi:hypothetical protein